MKIMEIEDFYTHVGQLREKGYEPYFVQGCSGGNGISLPLIRLRHPEYPGKIYCPLTAVCHAVTGDYCRTSEYKLAANNVNLRFSTDACIIQIAADGTNEKEVREILLRALDMSEVP